MKSSALLLITIIGFVDAISKPQISVQVRDGDFAADLKGLDPSLTWEGSTTYCDFDLKYGTEVSLHMTNDFASLPRNVWGKVSRKIGQWGVSLGAKVKAEDMKNADFEVAANRGKSINAKFTGSMGDNGVSVSNVETTTDFNFNGTHNVALTPRFNFASQQGDILIKYNKEKTQIDVAASKSSQKVRICREIDENNKIAPTFTSGGGFSLEWDRLLETGSHVKTKLTPNEAIDLEWNDGGWKANINMPIEGTTILGANVSIKRELKI